MKHIAVLMGGWSAEREVSLKSGAACAKALRELGYKVSEIDVGRDVAEVLVRLKPDVAFNALHGTFGEDGGMQGVLEMLQIPYTHSGVLASSVAMDKPMAKMIFEAAGLRCPKGKVIARSAMLGGDPMTRPYVAKPACEGSSVGVHIMLPDDARTLAQVVQESAEEWLIEEYIPGREITVAVLNNKPLGVTEIRPKSGFYDYENKYTDGKTEHLCPAPLAKERYDEVMLLALRAHLALGCRGLTRADFRFDDKEFYLLEVNTQPGMTALSLSPEIAAHAGISFNELVRLLVEDARLGK
ncbi:MAG: D-alanine--D-alanine ligase [Alphaproteobacteria bacterium]|nr:D-alanine--D-alanine ligase [Alphaproteobacteria bacterium]